MRTKVLSLLRNRSLAPDDPQDGESTPVTDVTATTTAHPLPEQDLALLDAWWRAANYLSVGQIYLLDNPLLRRPLAQEDIKPRLLGHWGTTPGLNLLWAHLNRLIRERDVNAIFLAGPGHGGPAAVANAWLEGTYSEVYPHVGPDEAGMQRLFRQFSFPGGIPSHVAPETPGLDPRGRRARLRALPRVRRRDGQPRPGRRRRGRRRRVRDRAAGGLVAREQVRRPGPRRRGAADPAPQRLQDRQPDHAGADPARGAGEPAARLRPRGAHRRGRRPGRRAPAAGRRARPGARHDPRDPAGRPRGRRRRAAAVADDPAGHPQGLDRAGRGRRRPGRGHLAGPPGAAGRTPARTTTHRAQLEEWMRSYRPEELFDDDGRLVASSCAHSRPPAPADERQPARQRRPAAPPARAAGLPSATPSR